ncbi:MAG: TIGR03564 family F420-dependent LLM class oxidoreductase [Myxococcales bacterium]|jgi:F420-dependent oxidoreductase-like protein
MRIGILVGEGAGGRPRVDDVIEEAKQAEADGFASAWLVNLFGNDPMIMAALAARVTEHIELGTAVVPTFTRHPHVMAQQALTLQAASDNRFTLGIGLSHKIVIENMMGLSWAKPYSHMKEYLAALAPLIREGKVDHEGVEYRVKSSLRVPGAEPCAIILAAMAPKMLALAGSQADGTVTWMTGKKTLVDYVVPRIREAAGEADRPDRPGRVVACLPICVTDDVEAERKRVGKAFAMYGSLPSYRAMLDREGAEGPADVALLGSVAQLEDELGRLAEGGVTDLVAGIYSRDEDTAAATRDLLVRNLKSFGG